MQTFLDDVRRKFGYLSRKANVKDLLVVARPGVVNGDASASLGKIVPIAGEGTHHSRHQRGVGVLTMDYVRAYAQVLDQLQGRFLQGDVHLEKIVITRARQLGVPGADCFGQRIGVNTFLLAVARSVNQVYRSTDFLGLVNACSDRSLFEFIVHRKGKFNIRICQAMEFTVYARIEGHNQRSLYATPGDCRQQLASHIFYASHASHTGQLAADHPDVGY